MRFMVALAVAMWVSPAGACPVLPPDLRASVRPINLSAPIPSNGSLVFLVDCWHACTACQAAERELSVTVWSPQRERVEGQKPQQIFLTEHATSHLVVWRPAQSLVAGDGYEVRVGVVDQSEQETYPFDVAETKAAPTPLDFVHSSASSYFEERGTLYSCDQSQTDCDFASLGFGSQRQELPALLLAVGRPDDPALTGQLLFHVMHHAVDGTQHWGSWTAAGEQPSELVRFSEADAEYCAEVEVRSLLEDGASVRAQVCSPADAPTLPSATDTDLDAQLAACLRPPSGLEPEWCALHRASCESGLGAALCSELEDRCTEPVARGNPEPARPSSDTTATVAAVLCAAPADPYARQVASCGCRHAPRQGQSTSWWLGVALLAVLRRRVEQV
jgi:MYXO-CTERM domain-containing protein